jgi:hypothetical protein
MGKKKVVTEDGSALATEAPKRKKKEAKQAALDLSPSPEITPAEPGAVPFIAPVVVKPSKLPASKPSPDQAAIPPSPNAKQVPDESTSPVTTHPAPGPALSPAPAHVTKIVDGEIIEAGEDEALLTQGFETGEIIDSKFWQKNDYFRSLLDPDVINKIDFSKYDLAKLLQEFFAEMFKEEYIDFKISGIAVHSAAKIYRHKITQVLEQQEMEEEELKKEALRRNIPNTISQPLRAGRAIATQEDFMLSMRSAIIDVMRKREKQQQRIAKQKISGEVPVEDVKKIRMKKMLPESIRKALLGKERIEDTLQRWFEIIHEKVKQSPDKEISYFQDLKPLVERKDRYGFRFEQARLFLSLMFLRNRDKIDVKQEDELADMFVTKN